MNEPETLTGRTIRVIQEEAVAKFKRELREKAKAIFDEELAGGAPTSHLVVQSLSRRVLALLGEPNDD